MCPSAPHLSFFTCLTPDDFTSQWGSSATKWVNRKIRQSLQLNNGTRAHLGALPLKGFRESIGRLSDKSSPDK